MVEKKAQVMNTENSAAKLKLRAAIKDDRKLKKEEKVVMKEKRIKEDVRQKGYMEKWLEKREKENADIGKKCGSEKSELKETVRDGERESVVKVEELAELFGGTQMKVRERAVREKVERDKSIERKEKSKKVREKREMFERIYERKKVRPEITLIETKKVKRQNGVGVEVLKSNKSTEKLTVTANSEKSDSDLKLKIKLKVDTTTLKGEGEKSNESKHKINTNVTEVTSFARFTRDLALERKLGGRTRHHLPADLSTTEGVGDREGTAGTK